MTTLRLRPDLEDALRALPDVQAVSIVTTGDATPTEVHVLASPGKPAKQIVRDVQSLAMASFDLDLDHRIVSVVQIGNSAVEDAAGPPDDDPTHGEDLQAGRPVIASVSMLTAQREATASVSIGVGDDRYEGVARGSSALSGRSRLVAVATINALEELLGLPCEVEAAMIVAAGAHDAALVVLSLTQPRVGQQVLSGSAVVRADPTDAIARAVLSALNRQLTT
jgi:hypothetical protein